MLKKYFFPHGSSDYSLHYFKNNPAAEIITLKSGRKYNF
jgi:hypothetical protein